MIVHRRQFVIGPAPLRPSDDWKQLLLDPEGRLHLSHCPDLPMVHVPAAAGEVSDRLLLGDVVAMGEHDPAPGRSLAEGATVDDVVEASRTWAGRWVLVLDGVVHLDACGGLSCLHRWAQAGPGGRAGVWVSSSPALLLDARLGGGPHQRAPLENFAEGFYYHPSPHTVHAAVKRLLPSQLLNLRADASGQALRPRPLPGARHASGFQGPDALLDRACTLLAGGAAAVAQQWPRPWLPLTAGMDSRVVLAAAYGGGVQDVVAYTQGYAWPRLSRGDRRLPPRLAATLGYEHRFIPRAQLDPDRLAQVDRHTGNSLNDFDADRQFLARGQWDGIPEGAAVLRGSIFEAGKAYYDKYLEPDHGGDPAAALCDAWRLKAYTAATNRQVEAVEAWAAWMLDDPHDNGLDWRDRFYVEQVCGAWTSAVEQELDLTGTHRIPLANCHALLSTLFALPREWQVDGRWSHEVVRRLAPAIADVPANPNDPPLQRIAWHAHEEGRMLYQARNRPAYVRQRSRQMLHRLRTTGRLTT
ncbi:MAG: hypothetical protein JWM90_595 [Thermoleophilia bacterium]|nr:hypothetical protein [Thermoleophilia bacterium]